jgi:hypothetical protein
MPIHGRSVSVNQATNRSFPAIAIGATWIAFLLSFEFPIPQEIAVYWLLRAAVALAALVGVAYAISGNSRWRAIMIVAAILFLVAYAVRMANAISDASELDLARGSATPLEHLMRGGKKVFVHYWSELDAPVQAVRFAYREAVMPLLQMLSLLYFWLSTRKSG